MATNKLLKSVAMFSLTILSLSFWFSPINALSVDHGLVARHNHDAIALMKRSNNTKRCKPRPSSSLIPSATPSATPSPSYSTTTTHTTTTTSSSSSSAASSTPSSGTCTKIGLAWPNGDQSYLKNFKTDHVSFIYTWTPEYPASAPSLGLEAMPMLWGYNQANDFKNRVVKGYANVVLGMNEPNEAGQSNMSPEDGAKLWQQYIQPLRQEGYKLITPAVSSRPNGKDWMHQFFAACSGCTYDVQAAHYYDTSSAGLITYMTDFHNTFKLDIAITEFADQNFNGGAQSTSSEITAFMTEVLQFCCDTPWIHSCFPFGFMNDLQGVNPLDSLMNSDGTPNALGELVLNAGS